MNITTPTFSMITVAVIAVIIMVQATKNIITARGSKRLKPLIKWLPLIYAVPAAVLLACIDTDMQQWRQLIKNIIVYTGTIAAAAAYNYDTIGKTLKEWTAKADKDEEGERE